ncbi:MAG: electron transporter RnfC, partial [Paludibacter sp.]
MRTFKMGGIHPKQNKLAACNKVQNAFLPKLAIIPLSQNLGAPSTAVVAKGDVVKVGQLIAQASGFVSANV